MIFDWQIEFFRTELAALLFNNNLTKAGEVFPGFKKDLFEETLILDDEDLKKSGLFESFEESIIK